MKKCDCYTTTEYFQYDIWGNAYQFDIGKCNGTRERDECSCGGDRLKCDFYPEVRKKAQKERESKFGKWISIDEKLPTKESDNKNTQGIYKGSYNTERVLCAIMQKSGKQLVKEGYAVVFADGTVSWKIPGTVYKVTHWMPLPQPPKGE